MLAWRQDAGSVIRAVTDRDGGHSAAPFASLNLGAHVGDDADAVQANRQLVADQLGLRLVVADQVHGREVVEVTPEHLDEVEGLRSVAVADALVTTCGGVGLTVLVADCTPVLVHAHDGSVIGAAHAGRPGMLAGVVPALVAAIRDLGGHDLRAVVGPSICGACYEVPADLQAAAAAVAPRSVATTREGTPAIDVAAGVLAQLADAGVEHVTRVPGCSREETGLYSYRRDGRTGRYAAIIGRAA